MHWVQRRGKLCRALNMSRRWLVPLVLSVLLVAAPASSAPNDEHAVSDDAALMDYVAGASRLEGRIRAPCCWNQTIDIHGSPVANSLRREIRERLKAGESPDTIEASIVNRYGEKILAVPDRSPLRKVAIGLSLLMGAAGVGAFVMLNRWRRRVKAEKQTAAPANSGARDALDDRVDEELDKLE
jgi:cytochrome c-type biogenesis protein CcmH